MPSLLSASIANANHKGQPSLPSSLLEWINSSPAQGHHTFFSYCPLPKGLIPFCSRLSLIHWASSDHQENAASEDHSQELHGHGGLLAFHVARQALRQCFHLRSHSQDVLILEVLFYSDTNGLPLNSIRSGVLPREPMPSTITVRLPSLEDLEAYAAEQWECFLLHLISSGQAERTTNFSSSMLKIFQRGLLSQRDKEALKLTESGFQFLLMDTNAQLWYIIREYITNSEAYNMNTLTDIQRNVIKDLADLGLVKLQQGFVVVETNFRVYAYSSSKLLCEILRLFSRVEYQLPNLIVAAITKESLYNAFENGIMAEQASIDSLLYIITFLQQNAHPRVAERIPSVPENVTDQIRLWESDMNRVEMTPASLFDEFPSRDAFEAACDFAREYGGVLWEDSKMRLVVKAEILGQIREFLRR
ncbi:hypothetical protein RHSIM_Rhsim02G0128000 [Rhododendron simsii]|uniref:RNA polymerase II transcription factor B subunit 2 n=1 Tax=Rhododendron simsii TaxID=118357 RepID=A0A834HB11_RHOSS|nr:hypothetical protein RHSIM_Rhsim02G0128000 [Rhododendron simsii]